MQDQIEQLKISGCFEEACTSERLLASVNLGTELDYLKQFAHTNSFEDKLAKKQLRALWTAYCFHSKQEVDTAPYDNDLLALWSEIQKGNWKDFDEFDSFMCKHLV